jgi:6-pyruvoyltetrahydropterin/6-carboxytetrahydropterin synthase
MPRLTIARRMTFSAAHRLYDPALSRAENERLFGKCANPRGHGHNYVLEVHVSGELDPASGMIVDLKWLKDVVESRLLAEIDHRNLNEDVDFLAGVNPTAENLALAFWQRLEPALRPRAHLARLRLWETENNFAEVSAD